MSECDFTWVESNLAVGAALGADHLKRLGDDAIRRVVDLRSEACDDRDELGAHGIQLLHLPTPDQVPLTPIALDMGVAWVCDALERGHRVLIHCQHGIGRSAMLASCVLVARGLDLPSALRQLKQTRCRVSPSPPQLQATIVWVETRARVRAEPVDLSWDELVDIVYAAAP